MKEVENPLERHYVHVRTARTAQNGMCEGAIPGSLYLLSGSMDIELYATSLEKSAMAGSSDFSPEPFYSVYSLI